PGSPSSPSDRGYVPKDKIERPKPGQNPCLTGGGKRHKGLAAEGRRPHRSSGGRMMDRWSLVVDSSPRMRSRALAAVVLVVALGAVAPVEGANVRRVLRTAPTLVGLPGLAADERYHNAADVILES